MAENTSKTRTIERELDSVLESADEAEHLAVEAARAAGFSEDDLHKIGMAVRESIVNAVVHGNRYNARKKVHFAVSGAPGTIRVTVGDEGEGFDPSQLPDPVAERNLLQQSGRGIFLMRAFMDRFEIRPRPAGGTEVELVKNQGGKP